MRRLLAWSEGDGVAQRKSRPKKSTHTVHYAHAWQRVRPHQHPHSHKKTHTNALDYLIVCVSFLLSFCSLTSSILILLTIYCFFSFLFFHSFPLSSFLSFLLLLHYCTSTSTSSVIEMETSDWLQQNRIYPQDGRCCALTGLIGNRAIIPEVPEGSRVQGYLNH